MPFLIFTTLLCIAFFWPVLFGQEQFAFRDTADFYYPLFEYVQSELQAGRLPLWMPYENIGQPLAANPVCSVFYPVKLIFFLPIDFVLAYHLFVIVHVWLAALTAYRLARHWKRSETAAVFAGLCYAFGGIVLFQHNNVPFLIGSAWLPEAIRAADRLLIACRHRTTTGNRLRRGAIALSLVVSLMTLGGDIQCVYHTLLMIGLLIFLRRKRVQRRLFLQATVLSGILIFLLTAVQVIPFWEFMRSCDRAAHANESIEYTDTHEYMRYDYSSGPWRWIEFIWPNIDGQKFPVNTRWCQLFEQPKSVWTPSLYMGLGPVLLGLAAYRLRKRNAVRVWTVGVLCAAMLASLGYYGVGWLLALNGVDIASLGIHEPFGGVYWLMVNVLPGYGMFRYPAKLLSIAALPICLLAADGFDIFFSRQRAGETKTTNTIKRQKRQRRPIQQNASTTIQQCGKYDKCRFRRRMYGLIGILCVATLCFNVAGQTKAFWSYIEAHLAPDVIFGPIIVPLAKLQIVFSLLHFFLLMVAIGYFVWRVFRTAPGARTSPPLRLAFIALLAVDLYVANTCLIPTVPRSVFQEPLVNFEASANAVPPVRNIHITIWC
ncbi:MAG: hypothetical protein FWC43_11585, partial [Planctomycetaceae bacterium]|nr:hypothetical protein [Planctomycetaceae bacterium]